jgi:hypothetical protein
MNTIPPDEKLNPINQYGSLDQLQILKDVCNKIYIARNISLSEDTIHEMFRRIDILFRDKINLN